ncbi:MAG: hypothetical protein AABZ67_14005 [Pseudomonadota bacterium]
MPEQQRKAALSDGSETNQNQSSLKFNVLFIFHLINWALLFFGNPKSINFQPAVHPHRPRLSSQMIFADVLAYAHRSHRSLLELALPHVVQPRRSLTPSAHHAVPLAAKLLSRRGILNSTLAHHMERARSKMGRYACKFLPSPIPRRSFV